MQLQDWMAHMERKRTELENAGHVMDDETFLTHVMTSLKRIMCLIPRLVPRVIEWLRRY